MHAAEDGTFLQAAAEFYIIPVFELILDLMNDCAYAVEEIQRMLGDSRSRFERLRDTMGQWPELQSAIGSVIVEIGKVLARIPL